MLYRAYELGQLLNVDPALIRQLNDCDLFLPKKYMMCKKSSNKFRVYDARDIPLVKRCVFYKMIGYSVSEIKQHNTWILPDEYEARAKIAILNHEITKSFYDDMNVRIYCTYLEKLKEEKANQEKEKRRVLKKW